MRDRRWNKHEIEYLHEHARDGADSIAKALGKSKQSVQSQAKRYGISLRRYYICPNCGQVTMKRLSPVTGWCPACCIELSAEKAAEKNRKFRNEIELEKARIKKEERRRQAIYTDNTRKKDELCVLRESCLLYDNTKKEEKQ